MADTMRKDRPNILLIMSDQHGPMFSHTYGHPLVRTPNMDRLAQQGATFDAAYCNAPLCIPSRLSFMTGKYVSQCKGWDNATPLPSDSLTWPYLLRSAGYEAILSGKMHFIGPDSLHGFTEQLAYDPHGGAGNDPETAKALHLSPGGRHAIYPWRDGLPTKSSPWEGIFEAAPGRAPMIEADDAIEAAALEYLRDPSRKDRPFALCVGFVAPHDPFIVPEPYFSMYYPDNTDLPNNPPGHLDNLPPAAQRQIRNLGFHGYTDDQIRKARAVYYGLVTYLDDKIGRLLDTLEAQGLVDNTLVIYASDHGDSLGEHGLWRKMNFYEQAVRIPLQMSWPGVIPGGLRIPSVVSLVDLTATILDVAGVLPGDLPVDLEGQSLMPLARGETVEWKDEAFAEHFAHGTDRARAMVRRGNWKLCYSHGEPVELELYNLDEDPGEFTNLADESRYREIQDNLLARIMELWGDPDRLTREVVLAQEARQMIRQVAGEDAPF